MSVVNINCFIFVTGKLSMIFDTGHIIGLVLRTEDLIHGLY
jgi:hypothetical protein